MWVDRSMDYKLTIEKNPDMETYHRVKEAVKANDGYCPCRLQKTSDTKCMCKEFREQQTEGLCHCGLYVKKEVSI